MYVGEVLPASVIHLVSQNRFWANGMSRLTV